MSKCAVCLFSLNNVPQYNCLVTEFARPDKSFQDWWSARGQECLASRNSVHLQINPSFSEQLRWQGMATDAGPGKGRHCRPCLCSRKLLTLKAMMPSWYQVLQTKPAESRFCSGFDSNHMKEQPALQATEKWTKHSISFVSACWCNHCASRDSLWYWK